MSKPYRPSNGTEGYDFIDRQCGPCKHYRAREEDEEEDCTKGIISNAWLYTIGEPEYPKEWIRGDDGKATCTAFEPGDPGPEAQPDEVTVHA